MKIRSCYLVLFLAFVALGAYYPTLFASFNSVDDRAMVVAIMNDPHIDLKAIFLPGISGYYYRPLLALSFYLDDRLWGLLPSFMHLENMLLHAANTVLVFLIAARLAVRRCTGLVVPFAAALLFALHPINTESVNWISGRPDLLAGCFLLLSILLLLISLERGSRTTALASSLCFLLACLSKEVAVCFFPAYLLMVWCYDRGGEQGLFASLWESLRRRYFSCCAISAAAAGYFICRHFAFSKADAGIATAVTGVAGKGADHLHTAKVVCKVLGFYVKKLFLPLPLNFGITSVSEYYIPLGILVLGLALYLVMRRDLQLAFFLGSLCIIAPAFLVALSRMAWAPIAERYLYVPSATFCIGITFLLSKLADERRLQAPLVLGAVLTLSGAAYATVQRNITWQDNLTLFEDTVRKSPQFPAARNELAIALKEQGRRTEGDRLLAGNSVGSAEVKNPEFLELNRANVLYSQGDLDGAVRLLRKNRNPRSGVYPKILAKLVVIDQQLLVSNPDPVVKRQLRAELIDSFAGLQERTGDPFFFYKIGQQHLAAGDRGKAALFFAKASQAAPEGTSYKIAAQKLAEKLKL